MMKENDDNKLIGSSEYETTTYNDVISSSGHEEKCLQ